MNYEGIEGESRAYYASALHPKHSQRSTARRRRSGSASEGNSLWSGLSSGHGCSRTDSISGQSNGDYHHPLTSPRNGSVDSAGVTRPHLSRTVNKIDDEMRDDGSGPDHGVASRKEEEKEVIVHEISPSDSLAGVSLKYGIGLADLRRANHLWANDSIHLRKVLYIPVDKSSRAREFIQEMRLNSAPLVDLSTSTSSQSSGVTTDSREALRPPDTLVGTGLGIKRVPMSQLSFFPPPSTSGKTPSISSAPSLSFSASLKPSSSQTRHSASPSLASILTVLPMAASTRDDLLARLSFDSAGSSFSDRSRPSLEQHEGHELEVVSNHEPTSSKSLHNHASAGAGSISSSYAYTPKPRYHGPTAAINTRTARAVSSRNTQSRHLSTTPPAAYIPRIPDRTTIRTVQLEPSPTMQLPISRSRKSQQPIMNGDPSDTTGHRRGDSFELQGPNQLSTG